MLMYNIAVDVIQSIEEDNIISVHSVLGLQVSYSTVYVYHLLVPKHRDIWPLKGTVSRELSGHCYITIHSSFQIG